MVSSFLKNMPQGQKKAGKLLVGFFSLVVVLTLVSRGLDTFSVATVSITKPTQGTLSRKITVEGTIRPLAEVAVAVPEGFLVQRVMAEEGSRVEEGDVLAVLDMDTIQRQLAEARRQLETAQLNAAKGNIKADLIEADPVEEARNKLDRAKEDLKTTQKQNEEEIEHARLALAEARYNRNKLYENGFDSDEMDGADKAVTEQEYQYEKVVQSAQNAITAGERAVEDAIKAVEDAEREQRNAQAKEDAEAQADSLDSRITALSVEEVQEKITRLETLLKNEGKILASVSGVITQSNIETGSITGSGGAYLLGEQEAGALFRGTTDEETGKRLNRGDQVELALPGRSKAISTTIDSVSPPKEKGGEYTVTVRLEEIEADPGTNGTLTMQKKGTQQGTLLPLSALHSDNGSTTSGYVYTLRETTTTMGVQTIVEKIPVQILDKNDNDALVEGPFSRDDRIVTGSSRSLTGGDRVREEAA